MYPLLLAALGAAAAPAPQVRAIEVHAKHLRALDVRPATLTEFVRGAIDLEEVSARLLGPHRRSFSKAQRLEFERLFVAILVARAWQKADALSDFEIRCAVHQGSVVRCELRRGGESVAAYFTVSGTQVVDARVGDVGMVRENRGAIDRLIRSRGVDGLLERMRRRVAEMRGDGAPKRQRR